MGYATEFDWAAARIARVTMTRAAEMNTLSHELLDELEAALARAAREGARALIITGSGRAFCCGAHLKYFDESAHGPDHRFDVRDGYLAKIAALFDRIESLPLPVIAAINGYALGGGFELALACDLRVMSKTARIGLPEVKLGATPGAGGVQKLQKFCGRGKAFEWILLARQIDWQQAERAGLLCDATEPDALMARALDLAGELCRHSPRALAQCKASIHLAGDVDQRSAMRFGIEALAALVDSADWREGMSAFKEKRAPEF